MIEFHKIVGVPQDVDPGEERVWYTDSGLTYVADNAGHPTRFGAGFHQGSTVPVGTPPAAGILYFCTSNGEYYLSNMTEWIVLNTETKTGGGGNAGYAGGVFITDLGNYYTSNEVEGALQEVGAAFPHLMGARTLQPINSNLLAFKTAGERRVGASLTGSPTTSASWLNQRQDSSGKTYGFMVADNGDAFTRHGDNFTQLASQSDLQEALEQMGSDIGGAIGEVEGIKVRAGLGIDLSGSGLLSNSPVISLDTNEVIQALDSAGNFPFVRDTGGNMTGNLTIAKATPAIDLTADIVGSSSTRTARVFTATNNDNNAGMRDVTGHINFLNFNMVNKMLQLISGETSDGVEIHGKLKVIRPNSQDDRGLTVETGNGHYLSNFVNDRGQISLLSDGTANWLQTDDGSNSYNPKDLTISGRIKKTIPTFRVSATDSRFSGRVMARNGMFIGMDEDGYGDLDFHNKMYMFPYSYRSGQSATTSRRYYSHIGYHQGNQTVYIRSFFKTLGKIPKDDTYEEKDLNVSASKFVTRSSEKFKKDIEEFTEKGLDIVEGTSPWTYKLKNDDLGRTNVGFILERGVPDFAIEDDGNSIDSYAMIAVLWKAVQELNEKVKVYESR